MEKADKPPVQTKFRWRKSEGAPRLYGNLISPSYTLFDVSLTVGRIVPTVDDPKAEFEAYEQGSLTISWAQAKQLRDMLDFLLSAYERANGEIKPLQLPLFQSDSNSGEPKVISWRSN